MFGPVLIPFLVILVVAVYWFALKGSSEKIRGQYRKIAASLELELYEPPIKMAGLLRPEPSAYGTHRARELSISVPGKGLQNTREVETVIKVEVRGLCLNAQLTATGALSGLKQRDSGGLPRWRSGHPEFDEAVDVRTDQGEALGRFLNDDVRSWLSLVLPETKGTLYMGQGKLVFARLGLIADDKAREDAITMIQFFCDLAENIET